jgi:hypothetical protein
LRLVVGTCFFGDRSRRFDVARIGRRMRLLGRTLISEMMMKFALRTAFALLVLVSPSLGSAEDSVTGLQSLTVQIWPDYDRPAVLVMMNGTLRSSASLPALVSLPLLPGAQLNAVARADASGKLFDDIVYTNEAGKLSLSTPSPQFRVEYYVPYRVEGSERHFAFEWLADVSVEALSVIVQTPASATSLVTRPPAADVNRGKDGLLYHTLPVRSVPAHEPLSVTLSYAAATTSLSAERRPPSLPAPAPPSPPKARAPSAPAPAADADSGWWLILAIFATAGVSMGITWQIARSHFAPGAGGETPPPERPSVRVCGGCGLPRGIGDRFCSSCGHELGRES